MELFKREDRLGEGLTERAHVSHFRPYDRDTPYLLATPGVDHAAQLVRLDSVVSLPLRRLRDSGLPSVAQTLAAIKQVL